MFVLMKFEYCVRRPGARVMLAMRVEVGVIAHSSHLSMPIVQHAITKHVIIPNLKCV